MDASAGKTVFNQEPCFACRCCSVWARYALTVKSATDKSDKVLELLLETSIESEELTIKYEAVLNAKKVMLDKRQQLLNEQQAVIESRRKDIYLLEKMSFKRLLREEEEDR